MVRLSAGDARLDVDPNAGGRIGSLVIGGRERLITDPDPSAPLPPITWGSFVMLPWVGRMRSGRLVWRDLDVQLPQDFGQHAIHGATYDRPWSVVAARDDALELELRFGPSPRWPLAATARQVIQMAAGRLDQRVTVTAREPMPVAIGWHPWVRREPTEPMRVVVPAATVLETAPDMIPSGAALPVDALTDLRGSAAIGDRRLDHTYVGVEGSCMVAWPDLELTVTADPLASVVVHSPPGSVCLEPQTAWPDAVRLTGAGHPTGMVELGAGESFEARTSWTWVA